MSASKRIDELEYQWLGDHGCHEVEHGCQATEGEIN